MPIEFKEPEELAPAQLKADRPPREVLTKIDSHHHFWNYDPVQYGWIDESKAAIKRDFGPADLKVVLDAAGVQAAISVQATQTLDETRWLLELAGQNEFIKGVVGWVPLIEPDVSEALSELAGNLKLRAIRHVLQDEADPNYILRADFNAGIRVLKQFGLVYDILIFERHLPQTIQFVDRHPNQVFVLDHLAKPSVKDGAISPWRGNMFELAKRPNVYCKISGLATEADYSNWTDEQLKPYIDVVLEAFGPRRLMFGSDWPVCLLAIEYGRWVKLVENSIAELSEGEQERIWVGTATEAYGLV